MSFVTQLGSKQYLVDFNYQFVVDNLNLDIDQTIQLPVVFSLNKDFTEKTVTAKVVNNTLGKKIRVVRFHNKTTYHKVKGFRSRQTVLEILKASDDSLKVEEAVKKVSPKKVGESEEKITKTTKVKTTKKAENLEK